MALVSYLIQGDKISIGSDGKSYTIDPTHPNYNKIKDAIDVANLTILPQLADVPASVALYSKGLVEIHDGEVLYNGQVLHNVICDRLLDLIQEGHEIDPLIFFLENLMDNPSASAREEMYLFMEANDLPITPDGFFLAYKRVGADYKDIHSRTFDNSVGQVVTMPRSDVDSNRDVTCSTGLHFCGLSYLSAFGGNHTMILKINPRDVVSIPSDYNNAKGRCCAYEVVGEHTAADDVSAFDSSVDDRFTDEEIPTVEDLKEFKKANPDARALPGISLIQNLFNWWKKV